MAKPYSVTACRPEYRIRDGFSRIFSPDALEITPDGIVAALPLIRGWHPQGRRPWGWLGTAERPGPILALSRRTPLQNDAQALRTPAGITHPSGRSITPAIFSLTKPSYNAIPTYWKGRHNQ